MQVPRRMLVPLLWDFTWPVTSARYTMWLANSYTLAVATCRIGGLVTEVWSRSGSSSPVLDTVREYENGVPCIAPTASTSGLAFVRTGTWLRNLLCWHRVSWRRMFRSPLRGDCWTDGERGSARHLDSRANARA